MVIMLVGILVALLAPTISGARQASQDTMSLSNLRQHAAVFAAYAGDCDDTFPFITDPDASYTVLRCESEDIGVKAPYFGAHCYWNYALADMYYLGRCHEESFYPPGYPHGMGDASIRSGATYYWYPCAFIGRPEFWDPRRRSGLNQLGPTRQSEVVYSSRKSLLVAHYPFVIDAVGPLDYDDPLLAACMTFVDGSGAKISIGAIGSGYPMGDGLWKQWRGSMHVSDGWPLAHHTLEGVRGWDVQR